MKNSLKMTLHTAKTFSLTALFNLAMAAFIAGIITGCITLSQGQKETLEGLIGRVPTPTPTTEPTATPEPAPTAAPAGFVEVDHSGFLVTGDEVADFAAWYGAEAKAVDGVTAIVIEGLAPARQKYLHDMWCKEKHKDMPTYNGGLVAAWGCE